MQKNISKNALIWLWLSAAIIAIDQLSKIWVLRVLEWNTPVPFIEGYWDWTLVCNRGAAFSFLSEAGGWQLWFFSILAILVAGLMTHWLRQMERGNWREALPMALIIAGALGNVIDRVRFGCVVDFVQWGWWPVFNVADSAIVLGVTLMLGFSLFQKQGDKH